MSEKWKPGQELRGSSDGNLVPQRITILGEPMYRPKLLLKSPSMRAISNYNNLSILDSNTHNSYENMSFIPESGMVDQKTYNDPAYTASITSSNNTLNDSKIGYFPHPYELYEYTSSIKTTTSHNGSELDSERNEMGSTTKLVTSKMGLTCHTWFTHLETVLCTISLAAGFGNLYRLTQATLVRGGLPFLVAYAVLTILIGLPVLFLELGIGQLAQEGFIKSWRAVPFFKGVGYVKLLAGCLLSIYYPIYMGLSMYYIIWTAKGNIPFPECAVAKIKEDKTGYFSDGIDGQQCLQKTFLESPFEDPYWYGNFAGILFIIWIIVTLVSIRRTKSFIISLSILLFPVLACFIALTVKSVWAENELQSLESITDKIDWTILQSASVWYYAAIQVFFSTNVGFGTFVTNAGIIYNKINPLWIALGYTSVNLLFGIGAVVICHILSGNLTSITPKDGDIAELHLISLVYTAAIKSGDTQDARVWAIIAYVLILTSGFISMATITYTLLKAITVQSKRRLKWWQTSIILSFAGLFLGCAVLLQKDFQIVHLLDHYVVGNLILISVIIEIFALVIFYGTKRIQSDFEFMLGHNLYKIWLILWWILPVVLVAVFVWALSTLNLKGIFIDDPDWLYGTGWAVVLTAVIFIFVMGCYTATKQDGYTLKDKFKSSMKPSHNWGPKDPMQRYNWVQWNSKTEQGERDFTLKRKGTRDYTRSIKKSAKKAALTDSLQRCAAGSGGHVTRIRTASTDYVEPYYVENDQMSTLTRATENKSPLRLTALVDSDSHSPSAYVNVNGGYKTNINPLARSHEIPENSHSEGYGTFRKGPYVIPDDRNIIHICHRRYSQSEDATEL